MIPPACAQKNSIDVEAFANEELSPLKADMSLDGLYLTQDLSKSKQQMILSCQCSAIACSIEHYYV